MVTRSLELYAIVVFVALLRVADAIKTITATGSKLFDSDGDQFFIKGVAYQNDTGTFDGLIDSNQCSSDASLISSLGANTIRIYSVDPTQDHEGCMNAFEGQGIYVLLDLASALAGSINTTNPEWTMDLYSNYTKILDEFQQYENLLGVFIGNEIIDEDSSSITAPYIKAAARDIKAYRDINNYRKIPVGYCAADVSSILTQTADYLVCGGNSSETIDLFGLNEYSWCGNSTFTESGYNILYEDFQNLTVPVFFSEDGCNTVTPRDFTDQAAIFGPEMDTVWSGAVIYEWVQQANDFGLVNYPSSGTYTATVPTPLPDYTSLSSQWASVSPSSTPRSSYTPSNNALSCPTSDSFWSVDPSATLPTIPGLVIAAVSTTSKAAPNSSGSSGTGTSSASISAQPTSTNTYAPSSGLSTGAKIAIGVTIPVVLILALIIAFLLYRRHRSRRSPPPPPPPPEKDPIKPELPAGPIYASQSGTPYPKAELDPNSHQINRKPIAEAPADYPSHELAGAIPPWLEHRPSAELPSSESSQRKIYEADAAVAELGTISARRRALAARSPVELEGSAGRELRELDAREQEVRGRLEELSRSDGTESTAVE